jgi:hypothetical protein
MRSLLRPGRKPVLYRPGGGGFPIYQLSRERGRAAAVSPGESAKAFTELGKRDRRAV